MATTPAQQRAVHRYVKKAYDRIELTVSKGKKEEIKARAAAQGETVNAYAWRLIQEDMERK